MDIMNMFSEYLIPVVVVICLIVGFVLKNYVKVLPNNYIPIIVTVLGAVIAIWVNMGITPDILAAGLASGLASTGLHQVLTRTLEKLGGSTESTDNESSDDSSSNDGPTAVG